MKVCQICKKKEYETKKGQMLFHNKLTSVQSLAICEKERKSLEAIHWVCTYSALRDNPELEDTQMVDGSTKEKGPS